MTGWPQKPIGPPGAPTASMSMDEREAITYYFTCLQKLEKRIDALTQSVQNLQQFVLERLDERPR